MPTLRGMEDTMTDDTPETKPPLIQLDILRYEFSRQFDTYKALRDWADAEIAQWQKLAEHAVPFKPWSQATLNRYAVALQDVRKRAHALTTNLDEQQLANERNELELALASLESVELIPT